MSKQHYRIILILLTVAGAVGALVTAPISLLTAGMAFDAPGSEYQTWAWIIFFIVLSIPLWFVIGVTAGWFLFLHDWPRTSLLLTATPLAAATIGWLLLQSAWRGGSARPAAKFRMNKLPPTPRTRSGMQLQGRHDCPASTLGTPPAAPPRRSPLGDSSPADGIVVKLPSREMPL